MTDTGGARVSELDGGVRVVTEALSSVRSVALGLWVATGSRDEDYSQAGVSHFLEHLLFKGTERYSSIELSELFDGMGAQVNAGTGKETTQLHARLLDTHVDEAFDVMAEMFTRPTYPDIDSERQVVIEEIAMYEDEPQDKVHDLFGEALFGEAPLGRPIIGRSEVISSIPIPDISAYHQARYTAQNVVVAAAGNLDHDHIVELARKHVRTPAGAPVVQVNGDGAAAEPTVIFGRKDTEQYHLCIGAPGLSRSDERRFTLAVLDAVFGGSTSSRLFREVREKRGLAYAVGSYNEQYKETGVVALYLGTREDNLPEACRVIGAELASIQDGVSEDELVRAKESVKGRLVLGMESTSARMNRIGKAVLLNLDLLTLDEMIARIDAVSVDDVAELAGELYGPEGLAAACIGRDEDHFRAALEPVREAAAA